MIHYVHVRFNLLIYSIDWPMSRSKSSWFWNILGCWLWKPGNKFITILTTSISRNPQRTFTRCASLHGEGIPCRKINTSNTSRISWSKNTNSSIFTFWKKIWTSTLLKETTPGNSPNLPSSGSGGSELHHGFFCPETPGNWVNSFQCAVLGFISGAKYHSWDLTAADARVESYVKGQLQEIIHGNYQ